MTVIRQSLSFAIFAWGASRCSPVANASMIIGTFYHPHAGKPIASIAFHPSGKALIVASGHKVFLQPMISVML